MRIGLLTFHVASNYGALFQAYATQEALKKLDESVEIIDYVPQFRFDNYKLIHPIQKRIQNKNTLNKIKIGIYSVIMDILNIRQNINKRKYFFGFMKKVYSLSNTYYPTYQTLVENPPEYDLYIVGSDQVWNPFIGGTKLDPAYFFGFVNKENACASYASSIGSYNPQRDAELFAAYIKKLHWVSVREDSAVPIIQKFTNIPVISVLDPTLLLTGDNWRDVACKPKGYPEKFIFYYSYGGKRIQSTARVIGNKLHEEVKGVVLGSSPLKPHKHYLRPEEVLWCFAHASYIVTDSFHATAFAINNNKPFYTIQPENNNQRVKSLLTSLGIEDRLFTPDEKLPVDLKEIDYTAVNEKLELLRQDSIGFLKRVIRERKEFMNSSL